MAITCCENCIYCYKISDSLSSYCHRKSPTINDSGEAIWPKLRTNHPSDWCGEGVVTIKKNKNNENKEKFSKWFDLS